MAVADHRGRAPFEYSHGNAQGTHPHVHGANLGFSAEAYLAADGFSALQTAEDHALVRALGAAERRILRTTEVNVVTSARGRARAPMGFSNFLSALAGAS